LVLYLVVFLLDFMSNPALATRGIYIKIAIIAALVRAVQSAAKIDGRWQPEAVSRSREERAADLWTTPWSRDGGRAEPLRDPYAGPETPKRASLEGPGPCASVDIREGSPSGLAQRPEPFPSSGQVPPASPPREVIHELLNRIRAREERPWWVQVGLWGIHSRSTAWVFFWIALGLAVAPSLLLFTVNKGFAVCGLFGLAALWYWLCIRWVDEHGSWS
jgi:hypothetical protein